MSYMVYVCMCKLCLSSRDFANVNFIVIFFNVDIGFLAEFLLHIILHSYHMGKICAQAYLSLHAQSCLYQHRCAIEQKFLHFCLF